MELAGVALAEMEFVGCTPFAGMAAAIDSRNLRAAFGLVFAQQGAAFAWQEPTMEEMEEPIALPVPGDNPREQVVALYKEFRPRLYRYIHGMGIGREQAEEVIQESFLRLMTHLEQGKKIENLRGWVVRVAQNLASDIRKSNYRGWTNVSEENERLSEDQSDPSPSPEEAYAHAERIERIREALQRIKPHHRQCFELRMQGFRYEDIGAAMGMSAQQATVVVNRVAVRLAAICE